MCFSIRSFCYVLLHYQRETMTRRNTYFCRSRNVLLLLLWKNMPYFSLLFSTYLVVSYLRCGYGFKLQQASPDLLMSMQQPSCPWSVASLPSSCAPDIRIHTGYNLYIYITKFCFSHPVLWTIQGSELEIKDSQILITILGPWEPL